MGGHLRPFGTVLKIGVADTGGRVQNCQCLVLRDALMIFSPTSAPLRSCKMSETGKKQGYQIQNVLTFENDGTIWAPEVAKTSRVLIGL